MVIVGDGCHGDVQVQSGNGSAGLLQSFSLSRPESDGGPTHLHALTLHRPSWLHPPEVQTFRSSLTCPDQVTNSWPIKNQLPKETTGCLSQPLFFQLCLFASWLVQCCHHPTINQSLSFILSHTISVLLELTFNFLFSMCFISDCVFFFSFSDFRFTSQRVSVCWFFIFCPLCCTSSWVFLFFPSFLKLNFCSAELRLNPNPHLLDLDLSYINCEVSSIYFVFLWSILSLIGIVTLCRNIYITLIKDDMYFNIDTLHTHTCFDLIYKSDTQFKICGVPFFLGWMKTNLDDWLLKLYLLRSSKQRLTTNDKLDSGSVGQQ